jgi:hypothetical protein
VKPNNHLLFDIGVLAASLALLPGSHSVFAHHSFAMFDQSKTLSLSGTVKEFQYSSPHAWIQLLVPAPDVGVVEWGFEMSSSAGLARSGWKKRTLVPGDKISVSFSPLRNGEHGGSFKSATFADGRPVGPQRGDPR